MRKTTKNLGLTIELTVLLSTGNIKDGEKPTTTFRKGLISKLEDHTSKTVLACWARLLVLVRGNALMSVASLW